MHSGLKIKFFPLKRNGEIAKTPIYTSIIDKEFALCVLGIDYESRRYEYSNKSLYSVYLEILDPKRGVDVSDQMFIGDVNITTERLLDCIREKVKKYRGHRIEPQINQYMMKMSSLRLEHDPSNLGYVALRMDEVVEKYKMFDKFCKLLGEDQIVYLVNEDQDNENYHEYRNIIDDIEPITCDDLKSH